MKTLYKQFIIATILILISSVVIGFAIVNVYYYAVTKEKTDTQNVMIAQEITRVLENMHDSEEAMDEYLTSIGKLGYQIVVMDRDEKQSYFGASFSEDMLPKKAAATVLSGEIYHGMQDFTNNLLMMGHFSNKLQNTVGVPFEIRGEPYGLFLRPDNKMIFSDIHQVLIGLVLAIASISILGVVLMVRQLIRPIAQLTEATKAVSNENYNYALNITRKDEIGQLAESFHFMQQQLAHNDEARKAFISNVSHDFQSPLMNIQGYADLLKGEVVSDDERREYLAIIDRESKRLSNLTKQLLLLTSLDQATYPLKLQSVRLEEQLKDVIRKYRWRLSEQEIELSYNLEETVVIADEELLVNVWENLLSNAIKYTDKNGKIMITCRNIGTVVEVTFKDTGIGMSEDETSQVFDRFYRVDQARKKDGTGLGLSIVKQVIQLHDGSVALKSELDLGSTFIITLPIKRK